MKFDLKSMHEFLEEPLKSYFQDKAKDADGYLENHVDDLMYFYNTDSEGNIAISASFPLEEWEKIKRLSRIFTKKESN